MADIIPAILPKSYAELEEKLELVSGSAQVVQIDICDGAYVQSRTWPYLKAHQEDQIFAEIVSQDKALLGWEHLDFEFDLMVKGVLEKIPDFISAGASRIVVHKDSVSVEELEQILKEYGKHSDEMGPFDIELGLGLANTVKPEDIAPHVGRIHFVQVMGINTIGHQGQSFEPRSVECVRALRLAYPDLIISVDGGVSLDTGKSLVDAGADSLVVGSGIFGTDNVLENLESFRDL
ncbi:MAG: hypothetical protein Q8L64_04910 [bacterium]|nr:hypothetical protein [bacterium]